MYKPQTFKMKRGKTPPPPSSIGSSSTETLPAAISSLPFQLDQAYFRRPPSSPAPSLSSDECAAAKRRSCHLFCRQRLPPDLFSESVLSPADIRCAPAILRRPPCCRLRRIAASTGDNSGRIPAVHLPPLPATCSSFPALPSSFTGKTPFFSLLVRSLYFGLTGMDACMVTTFDSRLNSHAYAPVYFSRSPVSFSGKVSHHRPPSPW